jgi:L-lactate dehydrogenase complex protein LldF
MKKKRRFIIDSEIAAQDVDLQQKLKYNIQQYNNAFYTGINRFTDHTALRENASDIKEMVVSHLDDFLVQFEKAATQNGSKVLWANDKEEAIRLITQVLLDEKVELVVKSKSMLSEEIHLNEELEKLGMVSQETDLGEFIVQTAGEPPFHIVTPAMHKSKEDVAELFHEHFQTPLSSTPVELTNFVREKLRIKYQEAGAGITGANFLIADNGSVALTENEGNGVMSTSFPKVHIVISGIEKVIPSMKDLGFIWPLLAGHGTGQKISAYNSIFNGPRKGNEKDGPSKQFIVLIDNRRSSLLDTNEHWQALKCIRCGACLNACPIYKVVGGYTYNTVYSGPIGSVITPYMTSFKEFGHLNTACTQCGKCEEVCPVMIPLPRLLLLNRKLTNENGGNDWRWDTGMKFFEYISSNRKLMDLAQGRLKNSAVSLTGKNLMGKNKSMPTFEELSFSRQWKIKRKNG